MYISSAGATIRSLKMIVETKIKLLSPSKFHIRSSKEAFLASKITEIWQSRDDVFTAVSGVFSRKEFDDAISNFIESGAVEENVNKRKKLVVNEGEDLRDYTQVCFKYAELEEAPELPLNLKKEILFLYYYGRNLDYYRMLNLEKSPDVTAERVDEKCRYYRSLFAGRNFENINMYSYRNKLQRVRKLIGDACMITSPEEKEKYDALLFSIKNNNAPATEGVRSQGETAEKHFVLAMKLKSHNKIKQAHEEILIAVRMDPENKEYHDFELEIRSVLNERHSEELFDALQNNEFVLLDEKKLESLIDNILELNEGSAQSHLRLAKIAIEKGMPEMAIEHSYNAVKIDPDLKNEVKSIVSFARKTLQELGKSEIGPKTFEIGKNDLPQKK